MILSLFWDGIFAKPKKNLAWAKDVSDEEERWKALLKGLRLYKITHMLQVLLTIREFVLWNLMLIWKRKKPQINTETPEYYKQKYPICKINTKFSVFIRVPFLSRKMPRAWVFILNLIGLQCLKTWDGAKQADLGINKWWARMEMCDRQTKGTEKENCVFVSNKGCCLLLLI